MNLHDLSLQQETHVNYLNFTNYNYAIIVPLLYNEGPNCLNYAITINTLHNIRWTYVNKVQVKYCIV